ncbi:kinase-like domain-containing protein [Zychaea mexicana]|uniref:kinase-like domain-containing protein n=1 Tax=Zychaea mexicana TaxID=64656 RepID=UPI0022FE5A81|nr:kinase-like domain-containing protein [Zychaea mexicana]KAI9484660.1 kinase-like domain-containing protein [Zychaea mexicana]
MYTKSVGNEKEQLPRLPPYKSKEKVTNKKKKTDDQRQEEDEDGEETDQEEDGDEEEQDEVKENQHPQPISKEIGAPPILSDYDSSNYHNNNAAVTQDPASCDNASSGGNYRDVRDIFGFQHPHHPGDDTHLTAETDPSFVRPPKSPLRPASKRRQSHQQHCLRRKSAEDLKSRRPSAPAFSTHSGNKTSYDIEDGSSGAASGGVALSRTSSASSCNSFLSSASSSSSSETPLTPSSATASGAATDEQQQQQQQRRDRRKSATFAAHHHHHHPHQQHISDLQQTESLGRKLDRKLLKSMEAIKHENSSGTIKGREKLYLKNKDGLTRAQYQLGNCIGKGQFGSVYRALDLTTGETVAVKRIRLDDAELDKEIMKEVGLLKTLSHSNVIQYMGFIRSKHHMNIVLEYAENGSLMSTLKAFGAFPEKLVASFCIKILNGLEYLHANQVVHCDLKAANILTTKTGDVKLSDFGVSLNLKIKGSDPGSVSGTPNWMAPEVIELKGASTKSDIWSLGCTLVELVTGKPPYADMIAMSAMFRIVEDNYPPLPANISQDMHSFLLCCFQKNPEERPTAAQLKDHSWIRANQRRMKKNHQSSTHGISSYLEQHKQQQQQQQQQQRSHKRSSLRPTSSASDYCHPLEQQQQQQQQQTQQQRPATPQPRSPVVARDDASLLPRIDTTPPSTTSSGQAPDLGYSSRISHDSGLSSDINEDYTTHRFIQTSFGKVVECKVCGDLTKSQAIFCEVCALICHEDCKKQAFSCPPKVKDQQPSYDVSV